MSRHEGVSCDSCLKENFSGKRYKCLVCYDYDLCATCFEAGCTTSHHTIGHPMQCILTRSDYELYYGGEPISVGHPQSLICPFCGKMGLTENALLEHVTSEHSDASSEVVCPVCATLPGGEPNHMTDDFASHLTVEHVNNRDIDESSDARRVRRITHHARGMNSVRARRSQMQFSSSGGLSSISPSSRESMDPIAELLSQLSGVRRTANLAQSSTTSQLQQLHMQLQLERQQAQVTRQQLERLPRRQSQLSSGTSATTTTSSSSTTTGSVQSVGGVIQQSHYAIIPEASPSPAATSAAGSQFLLSRFSESTLSEAEQQILEVEHADRSLFVQELLLNTIAEHLMINEDWDSINKTLGVIADLEENLSIEDILNKADNTPSLDSYPPLSEAGQAVGIYQQQRHSFINQNQGQISQSSQDSQQRVIGALPLRRASAPGSSSARQGNRNVSNMNNQSQPLREGPVQPTPGRGNPAVSQRVPSREGLSGSRQLGRTTNREGASPSSARRKVLRHIDDRNKSSEPPPPH